jgi:hypothetical protein
MMLVSYPECGFSLLPKRKSFARGTPFLLKEVKKCQSFFINDLVHVKNRGVYRAMQTTFMLRALMFVFVFLSLVRPPLGIKV